MSLKATEEDHLVFLLALCLHYTMFKLHKRDSALAKNVVGEIRNFVDTAQSYGWKPPMSVMVELLHHRCRRRISTLPFEQTTPGLARDFDQVFIRLQNAPRETWLDLVEPCLQRLSKTTTRPSARMKDLKEDIGGKRTARQAALAILQAAGRGDPSVISTRLQRAGHRVTSRRRPKR